MKNKTDLELIELVQKGNEPAFEQLYKRYHRKVYITAFSIMRQEADAQDVVQAVFLQLHKSIHGLRNPDYFLLWLNRITCHKCKDLFRKKNRILTIDLEQEQIKNEYQEEHREYDPEKQMKFQSDKELLDDLISQLPYLQREVVVLCYFQSLSMQEIADVLQEPVGTIKSRLYLARKQLRKQIISYQSREGILVTFEADTLETLLLSYFTSLYTTKTTQWNPTKSSTNAMRITNKIFTTLAGKAILASVLVITGAVTFQQISKDTNKPSLRNSQIQSSQETVVKSERHAYFTLLNWAANEQQLNNRTQEEAQSVQPLYEYLKIQGGPYWEYLSEKGWANVFESLFL